LFAQIEGGENDYDGGDRNGDSADIDRELGDDVFGGNDNGDGGDATSKLGHEAWVGTDRDYTYPEVSELLLVAGKLGIVRMEKSVETGKELEES
jgi:hypothetical protein